MGLFVNNGGGTTIVNVEQGVPYDRGNFSMDYEYDKKGRIIKEIITGDISRITEYTYIDDGLKNEGKILIEIIRENNKRVSRIFSYDDNGKIINIHAQTDEEGDK